MSGAELGPAARARRGALPRLPAGSGAATGRQRTGGLAIGYMPIYVPRELLHAQGVLPVGIMGGGEDLEIIRGDAYYQSYICHIPRSTIELGLNGSLDCLDGMIFPAICDVIRNLSGMWKLLFPDKLVALPRRAAELRPRDRRPLLPPRAGAAVARDLEARGARTLRRGGAARSRSRSTTRTAGWSTSSTSCAATTPWKVPTVGALPRAARRAGAAGRGVQRDARRPTATRSRPTTSRKPMDQARVLVTGSFCEQPPLGLIKTLERSGCYIVDDDFVQVHRWIQGDDRDRGRSAGQPGPGLPRTTRSPARRATSPTTRRGGRWSSASPRAAAEGVLFCAPSFCDPALLDQPMAVRAVEERGVPWTAFKYAENTGQFQVIREQAGTFADSIKLWSEV